MAPYEIPLAARDFVPEAGLDPALRTGQPQHAFLQLSSALDLDTLRMLNDNGAILLGNVYGTTYIASLREGWKLEAGEGLRVRWIGALATDDKIEEDLRNGRYADYGLDPSGALRVVVVFHRDVTDATASNVLKTAGAASFNAMGNNQWKVVIGRDFLFPLASGDSVSWIEQGPMPLLPLVEEVRNAIQVDPVQGFLNVGGNPTYSGLDGTGVTVAVFDTAIDPDHDDFWEHDAAGNRTVTRLLLPPAQPPAVNDIHGTHVAGIIASNGYQSDKNGRGSIVARWRGMAPHANLVEPQEPSYAAGFFKAVNQFHAGVSNHSYVQTCNGYTATASDVDTILRGDGAFNGSPILSHTMVWGAGNNGSYSQYCGTLGYYSIISPAKNPIVVASTNADDLSLAPRSSFSSLGPTEDGRLKPDVSAPGCKTGTGWAWGVVSTWATTNGYTLACGTSMASPAGAGTVALLLQQWHKTYGAFEPFPSSMKVALVQGATDLIDTTDVKGEANNPDTGSPVQYHAGPDFATGYGLINAVASKDIIAQRRIVEENVDVPGEVDRYEVTVPAGATRLRVTLAWDDEPGSFMTSKRARKLVNDLDLEVGNTPNVVLPWVLPTLQRGVHLVDPDPIRPSDIQPAQHGVDRLNNVEQVEITNPAPGTWPVRVKAFALPNGRRQSYSVTADFAVDYPPIKNPPQHQGENPCISISWEPARGHGLILNLPSGFDCGFVAFPPICRSIYDCPPCGAFGSCPPYTMQFPKLPDAMRVAIFDENGSRLSEDARPGAPRLTFTPEPGVRPYIVFFSDNPQRSPSRLQISFSFDPR
jgi:subtilisin family serine protease